MMNIIEKSNIVYNKGNAKPTFTCPLLSRRCQYSAISSAAAITVTTRQHTAPPMTYFLFTDFEPMVSTSCFFSEYCNESYVDYVYNINYLVVIF